MAGELPVEEVNSEKGWVEMNGLIPLFYFTHIAWLTPPSM
jgi:hypothetical protein